MTPETAQAIAAVCALLDKLGTAPIGVTILIILFGPWIFSFIMTRIQEKRFDAMKKMYESNVKLVDCYENLAGAQNDVIVLNTAKWSEALDKIDTNQFCPLNRTKKHRMEDIPG